MREKMCTLIIAHEILTKIKALTDVSTLRGYTLFVENKSLVNLPSEYNDDKVLQSHLQSKQGFVNGISHHC